MNWSPRAVSALALVALVVLAGCSGVVSDNADPEAIAEQVQERHDRIEDMHGVQTTSIRSDALNSTVTTEVWQRPPDEYRQEVLSSSSAQSEGDVTVSDGETTWYYDSDANEVTRIDVSGGVYGNEMVDGDAIERMLEEFDVEFDGTETVADREAQVLVLHPTDENDLATYDEARVWVDSEYWYPLKYEVDVTTGNRTTTVTMAFEEVAFNQDIPDERFAFEPPEDAEVRNSSTSIDRVDDLAAADEETDFSVGDPEVPEGYALQSVQIVENDGDATVVATYESDDASLSYSVATDRTAPDGESVRIGDTEGTLVSSDTVTAAYVSCDGVAHTVTGSDAGEEPVVDALASLECT